MGRDDRAHRVRDYVRALDARSLQDHAGLVEEQRQRQRALDPVRASRSGKVESKDPVMGERRQQGGERVGGPSEAMDHQHRLALALDLDGHALDEHCRLPAATLRHGRLRHASQKVGHTTAE